MGAGGKEARRSRQALIGHDRPEGYRGTAMTSYTNQYPLDQKQAFLTENHKR